jgi:hypothetical protein
LFKALAAAVSSLEHRTIKQSIKYNQLSSPNKSALLLTALISLMIFNPPISTDKGRPNAQKKTYLIKWFY